MVVKWFALLPHSKTNSDFFFLLIVAMATIHHPQTCWQESGLCGCKCSSFGMFFISGVYCIFVCCRVWILSVVLEMPNLATVLPSTSTPATPPWLTGVHRFMRKRDGMYLHTNIISIKYHTFPICFFFLVSGASTTQMETFWLVRKRDTDVFAVNYHRRNDGSISSPHSLFRFPFLCLCVCLCSPPAGWDPDHHRIRENEGRTDRNLRHPGENVLPKCHSFHIRKDVVCKGTLKTEKITVEIGLNAS